MSDELRENVILEILSRCYVTRLVVEHIADAAIALIRDKTLEEAAKVGDAYALKFHAAANYHDAPEAGNAAEIVAAAIRAMKDKP